MALLWPESDQARARHSLDQALYTVRRVLGSEAFVAGPATLALNPAILSSDVADFVAATEAGDVARAMDLYHGDFLDGFHLTDAAILSGDRRRAGGGSRPGSRASSKRRPGGPPARATTRGPWRSGAAWRRSIRWARPSPWD